MSEIEGFSDWNLGMVRDFIACMDKARRKYSNMKVMLQRCGKTVEKVGYWDGLCLKSFTLEGL